MRTLAILWLLACPLLGRAAEYNLATLNCDRYENEIVGTPDSAQAADPMKRPDSIDMVMWLFGYTVGKAGEHLMYGDALASFGFALDAECRNNPSESLLQALAQVRPKRDKPMDLMTLNCADFETRHADSVRADPQSANTIMMWLFGYSIGETGGHIFDAGGVNGFADALKSRCTQHSDESLYDALVAMKSAPSR
jgi:HdeA/HdeB family